MNYIIVLFIICIFIDVALGDLAKEERKKQSKSQISQVDEHLLQATYKGLLNEVKKALSQGADVNILDKKFGSTPLIWASKFGYRDIVQYLLSKKAKHNVKSKDRQQSAIMWAVHGGYINIVNDLIAAGASAEEENYRGDTPLALAAYMGHTHIVDRLVDLDVEIDLQTKNNDFTALHFACYKGHVGVVRRLLEAGADRGLRDSSGKTPLMLAAMGNHVDVIDLLLDSSNKNLDEVDRTGYTALILAVTLRREEAVIALVTAGAETEHRISSGAGEYKEGDTALLIAVRMNSISLVRILLLLGVEAEVRDRENKSSAAEIALDLQYKEVYALLQSFILIEEEKIL